LLLLEVGVYIGIPAAIGVLYTYIQFQEMKTLKMRQTTRSVLKAGKFVFPIFSQNAQGLRNDCLMGYAKKLATEGKFKEIAAATKIPRIASIRGSKRIQEWKETVPVLVNSPIHLIGVTLLLYHIYY